MSHGISELRNIINQLEHAIEDIAKTYDVEHLAGPQGHVLYYLSQHDGEDIFVKDIEKYTKLSKSVASNLVKRMVKNGFITITSSATDKRYKKIAMTDLGRSKLIPLKAWHDEMVTQLFTNIPAEDFKTVTSVLKQLDDNIKHYKERKNV